MIEIVCSATRGFHVVNNISRRVLTTGTSLAYIHLEGLVATKGLNLLGESLPQILWASLCLTECFLYAVSGDAALFFNSLFVTPPVELAQRSSPLEISTG
jgi:hypothetical protein